MPPSHDEKLGPRPGGNRRIAELMISKDNTVMINRRINKRVSDTGLKCHPTN